ncbi:MAG: glycosyltransferase [Bacteroidia bacterium]|nr:glycosyltransferase [Bacteroidia bacterium]
MNIAFLTSGHSPFDDRIYYHLGKTLEANGHNVLIISSKTELREESGNIPVNCFNGETLSKREKLIAFSERLEAFNPERAICSEPLPLIASKQYRRKKRKELLIIYDITEWYPSARFLKEYHPAARWFGFLKLLFFNIYASLSADAFIFGERYKSKPYRFLFPFTPGRFITYFPDLKYISYKDHLLPGEKLRLSYSGEISIEKGFGNFIKVVSALSDRFSDLEIEVRMVAWYSTESDRKDCESLIRDGNKNIRFQFPGRQIFTEYTSKINETDIFLDLRKITFENNYSLPIKLFYYAALGRPVIFSDLKAIRNDFEIEKFGFLVNPEHTEEIVNLISGYLKNRTLYEEHCINARKLAEEKYNWGKVAPEFLNFIESV